MVGGIGGVGGVGGVGGASQSSEMMQQVSQHTENMMRFQMMMGLQTAQIQAQTSSLNMATRALSSVAQNIRS